MIAFIGNVFSPYYAWARRSGAAEPLDHCALNVALYGAGGKRWALTERRRGAVRQSQAALTIGRSAMSWDGNSLSVEIDEIAVPLPRRLRGRVRLYPHSLGHDKVALDAEGRHRWHPIAPFARVEVALETPALRWSGSGYLDANDGDAPLEAAFAGWHWSRANRRHDTIVLYDVSPRDSQPSSLAVRFAGSNSEWLAPPPAAPLPRTRWRLDRTTRADFGSPASLIETLEDAPFYARSVIAGQLFGERATAIHETLSLDRFRASWVKLLLPFRMPRV